MSFPSLLFTNHTPSARIPACVPEDIKLTLLLPAEIMPAMCIPCGREDILARQEFFRALDKSPELLAHLARLSENAADLQRCWEHYQGSRCDNERNVICLSLLHALVDFYRTAAALPSDACMLYSRFVSFFADAVKDSAFVTLTTAIDELYPSVQHITVNRVRINGSKVSVAAEAPVTYEERLARCAESLGFSAFSPRRGCSYALSAQIIDGMAQIYPAEFKAFAAFHEQYHTFFDEAILQYKLELDFYTALAGLLARLRKAGIPTNYPTIASGRGIDIKDAYDITLLAKNELNIVPNHVEFNDDEPFFYLTGANGGGKTTYLRTVGVALLLFLNGCALPCTAASIGIISSVYTHFPRDERFDGDGRFADEKKRIAEILEVCGDNSVILLNETFATTSEEIAVDQTVALAEQLYKSGCYGVYITHQHGLGTTEIPFLNVIVDLNNMNRRTYKIAKRKGIAGSYASDILKKYSLTREDLVRRFGEPDARRTGGAN